MFLVAVLIFQAHMCKAFADEASTKTTKCTNYKGDIDGYTLLAVNATFRLVETTFRVQYGNTYRCITATTTYKDDAKHEVTENVEYKVGEGDRWDDYTQTFIFELDNATKKYNKMRSLEPSGAGIMFAYFCILGPKWRTFRAPNGNYEFLSTDPHCTVIKALSFKLPPNGAIHPEERDADKVDNVQEQYDCMLWVKDDTQRTPDQCCTHYFKELCRHKEVRQAFTTTECQKRTAESNPGEDTKTDGN